MQNNTKAESLVAVVISVFILSFTLLGIINIFSFNNDINNDYRKEIFTHIIEGNASNLIKKIDYSNIGDGEDFYIYKNTTTREFEVMPAAEVSNEENKYINTLGEKITNTPENIGNLYERVFTKRTDILRHNIKPPEIPNIVFHYDATNLDGDGSSSSYSDNDDIPTILDLSGNNLNMIQTDFERRARFGEAEINTHPMIKFDGINDVYHMDTDNNGIIQNSSGSGNSTYYYDGVHPLVNKNNQSCGWNSTTPAPKEEHLSFPEKSLAIVLKTGSDVNSFQMIYEQGGIGVGYNFAVANGNIYAGIHNKASEQKKCYDYGLFEWDSGHKVKSVNLGEALPNTIYYIMVVQDSKHVSNGQPDNLLNRLKIYMNGELASETNHVDPMPRHHKVGLGAIVGSNIEPFGSYNVRTCSSGDEHATCEYFRGGIGELIMWNYAISGNQVKGIQNYFIQKWITGESITEYDLIETNIKKTSSL